MKQLLLIAYYFPPLGGGGVQRPLQWVRHLPAQGWMPTVLTVEAGYWSSRDESGLARIPPEVRVVRTPYISAVSLRERARKLLPARSTENALAPENDAAPERSALRRGIVDAVKPLWQTPDEFFGWYPFAVRAARRLLSEQRFHAVLTTAPPFTCHWIGRNLRMRGGPPWVCDFRDAWTRMPDYPHTNPLQLAIERSMEHAVLRRADCILTTTEPTARDFAEIHPPIAPRTHVIPNGYDPELYDFSGPDLYQRCEKLRFVFTGTQLLGQDLARFAQSLRTWIGTDSEKAASVRVTYAGSEGSALKSAAGDATALIEELGYLPNLEIAPLQQRADVLLYLGYEPNACESVVPGKLYEYLAARRPVLALTHPGPAAQWIERARAGW
ncbi:MAG: glycosyltransferase, partial [Chrysiogenetes bacterium]|nr:glycosyltransferase [Chrysiogenetes bacterium]